VEKNNSNLVIITRSFPYGKSESFLETEIQYLATNFEKIIIWPLKTGNDLRQLPSNVKISNVLNEEFKSNQIQKLDVLFSPSFLRNVRWNKNYIKKLYTDVVYIKVFKNLLNQVGKELILSDTLFYTYWFASDTVALSTYKKAYNYSLISRTHGSDLYEKVSGFKYFPFRSKVLNTIDRIFTISNDGIRHLHGKYNFSSRKVQLARLGTLKGKINARKSSSYDISIVSCAFLTEVKRIELLLDAVSSITDVKVKWTHIGGGPLETKLISKGKAASNNIEIEFLGNMKNPEIHKHYQNNFYDAFINVSSSEGIPVSIMEAQSYEIPVIATDVGGVSEIVNAEVGYLLPSDPTVKEVRDAILSVRDDAWAMKRKMAYENWKTNYSAEKNYTEFAANLKELVKKH